MAPDSWCIVNSVPTFNSPLSHIHTLANNTVHLGKSRSLCFTLGRALVNMQPCIIRHHQVAFRALKSSFYLLWLPAKRAQQLGAAPSPPLTSSASCRKLWHLQKSITSSAETEELYLTRLLSVIMIQSQTVPNASHVSVDNETLTPSDSVT